MVLRGDFCGVTGGFCGLEPVASAPSLEVLEERGV